MCVWWYILTLRLCVNCSRQVSRCWNNTACMYMPLSPVTYHCLHDRATSYRAPWISLHLLSRLKFSTCAWDIARNVLIFHFIRGLFLPTCKCVPIVHAYVHVLYLYTCTCWQPSIVVLYNHTCTVDTNPVFNARICMYKIAIDSSCVQFAELGVCLPIKHLLLNMLTGVMVSQQHKNSLLFIIRAFSIPLFWGD